MKQRSLMEYVRSPLQDYNIKSAGWLGKSGNDSPVSSKSKTGKSRMKSKSKTKSQESPKQKTPTEVTSPLDKWIQRKKADNSWDRFKELNKYNQEDGKKKSKLEKKSLFCKSDSFEKYGVILPTVDDILKNKNTVKQEGKILDAYEDLDCESDISIPASLECLVDSPEKIPLLTCEHLPNSKLKEYVLKYSDYLENISKGKEFSQRHKTYNDYNSRSKLTYSYSNLVFSENQLEYLMKKVEKILDPEGKRTEYLFMVLLPELCLKIFMDNFEMNKEEAIDYLNRRPID